MMSLPQPISPYSGRCIALALFPAQRDARDRQLLRYNCTRLPLLNILLRQADLRSLRRRAVSRPYRAGRDHGLTVFRTG